MMKFEAMRGVLTAFVMTGVVACAHPERLPPPPEDLIGRAEIPGMPGVRYRTDEVDAMLADGLQARERELAWRESQGETGLRPPTSYLAVSGGGDNGAFGAGLLLGWTDAGTRPDFKLVTGISTGALTAPFAFLGPDYDDELKEVYTTITEEDVLTERGLLAAINDDAMTDTAPLWELVSRFANEDLLRAVAQKHEEGKMLLVATTDLDARRAVIWNMGKIAASGHPDALNLFRSVLIASAAIPGAFPPTMFDVEVDGQRFQEMHVDGGVMAQVFVYPTSLNVRDAAELYSIELNERRLYIISNARLDPAWAAVDRQTISIAGRSIGALIQSQGFANLFWIYAIARRDDVEYNLAFIGEDFDVPKEGQFDTVYMNALFDYGYGLGRAGYDWEKTPPGLAGGSLADGE